MQKLEQGLRPEGSQQQYDHNVFDSLAIDPSYKLIHHLIKTGNLRLNSETEVIAATVHGWHGDFAMLIHWGLFLAKANSWRKVFLSIISFIKHDVLEKYKDVEHVGLLYDAIKFVSALKVHCQEARLKNYESRNGKK